MYWTDEPATERQLLLLKEAGFASSRPLTNTEAARLIREYQRRPVRPLQALAALSPAPTATVTRKDPPQPNPALPDGDISESTRTKAYTLRRDAETARRALAETPAAPNVRADAVTTTTARQEFWLDTCREVKEMQLGTVQVFELYQRYGCRFFAPTRAQVQEVLDALDNALPAWDKDHPEVFYQTLELNFPQLVRQ